jgi:disulfide oxidoreductase YuzD
MTQKTHIWLCVGVCLLVLTTQIQAQDEQWLQYHSSREAGQILGGTGSKSLDSTAEKPAGVKLPQFKGQNQLFAKWNTPMVKDGYLWIALDRTHKQRPYDLLYIDSNANGNLDDETAAAAYRTDQSSSYFGPVKVIFEVEDGPVTYHLNLRTYHYRTEKDGLFPSTGGWYEGDITVRGEKKHCVLYDYNANGTFNDKSANAHGCDRIRIGKQGGQDTLFTGNYIKIDETLYRPEIARDGACIKLIRAENVSFGSVRLPETITQFSANGENGLFILKPEKGIASLPVGKYCVYDWAVERKDEKGTNWKLKGSGLSEKNAFDITEGKQAVLSIGEPIVATLGASEREGTHSFRQSMKGRAGERIELTRNGAQPQAPKVHIKSNDGTYDRTYSFQYG